MVQAVAGTVSNGCMALSFRGYKFVSYLKFFVRSLMRITCLRKPRALYTKGITLQSKRPPRLYLPCWKEFGCLHDTASLIIKLNPVRDTQVHKMLSNVFMALSLTEATPGLSLNAVNNTLMGTKQSSATEEEDAENCAQEFCTMFRRGLGEGE